MVGVVTKTPSSFAVVLQLSSSRSLPYRWWEEQELRDLTASMGLQNFQRHRRNRFILFAVTKPESSPNKNNS